MMQRQQYLNAIDVLNELMMRHDINRTPDLHSDNLISIVQGYLHAQQFDTAYKIAQSIHEKITRIRAMCSVAEAFGQIDRLESALEILGNCIQLLRKMPYSQSYEDILITTVKVYIVLNCENKIWDFFTKKSYRDDMLFYLAKANIRAGKLARAINIIFESKDYLWIHEIVSEVFDNAPYLCEPDIELIQTLRSLPDLHNKDIVLANLEDLVFVELLEDLIQQGRLNEALTTARTLHTPSKHISALWHLSQSLCDNERSDDAIALARWSDDIRLIIKVHIQTGQFEMAHSMIRAMTDLFGQLDAELDIVAELYRIGQHDQARLILDHVYTILRADNCHQTQLHYRGSTYELLADRCAKALIALDRFQEARILANSTLGLGSISTNEGLLHHMQVSLRWAKNEDDLWESVGTYKDLINAHPDLGVAIAQSIDRIALFFQIKPL